jgi:hypothetical protein
MTILIVAVAWVLVLGGAWALCAAAGRADEHLEDWDREDSK